MATLPIFVLNNLACGLTTLIPDFDPRSPDKLNPEKILSEINQYKITTTAGSPIIYEKLADYVLGKNQTIKSIKKLFVGGAPVFPELAE